MLVRVTAILILLLVGTAGASHGCASWTTSDPDVDTNPTGIGPRHYVANDDCNGGCILSLWIYEESNGIPGLQRGDDVHDDTCHGMIASDTILY